MSSYSTTPLPANKKKKTVMVAMGPTDTPWAMQEVREEDGTTVRVEPTRKPRKAPWTPLLLDRVHPSTNTTGPVLHGPPAWSPDRALSESSPKEGGDEKKKKKAGKKGTRQISAQNSAAIEAGAERYGLIDMGPTDSSGGSSQSLTVHARKCNKMPHTVLNTIRPGSVLFVKRSRRGGRTMQLRVRFTTPAKYYSPGAKLSTLSIGVDGVDWQSLIADAHRI